jgi:type IV pilus assembly protein PilC
VPRYFYTAKTKTGETFTGAEEARDEHELARILRQKDLILISAFLEEEKIKKRYEIDLSQYLGVSLTEKLIFTRNFQVMVAAGISLPRALTTLANQTKNQKFKKTLNSVAEEVTRGKSLSEALAKFPEIFPELYISMVKVGEEAGNLEEVLKVLAQQMERVHELKSRVKGAMLYPAIIICAMIGIGILMLIMVVPKLASTFAELGIELPLTTRMVISVGLFLSKKWFLVPFLAIGAFFFLRMILKTGAGKEAFDTLFLKIPIIAPIVKKTNTAYTARTLSSLISAGVPIVRALEVTSGALGNVFFKRAIRDASEKVKKGGKLSEALVPYQNIYPPILTQMIAVGEETGQTSEVLAKLANFFEEEVGRATKNLSAVIEPLLMIIIGGIVGFFAISMIQPMYSMLGAI